MLINTVINTVFIPSIATLFAFIQISAGLMTMMAGRIAKRYSFKLIIYLSVISLSILVGLNYFPIFYLAVGLFAIVNIICEIIKIIFNDVVQRMLPDGIRASASSFIFFIESIFLSISYLMLGKLFDISKPNIAISCLSFIGFMAFIFIRIYFILEKRNTKSQ